ncbi:PSD1 and planctomycete cytochrome C domain-containing protein [Humisphaera borealis]|uniref:PSD1 domain-containing protein n=1 Tax=Humisphaera borealis TaxID=2807512 RepID=A0A7M2WU51_9BACT|nr:PSD1 and planctomycete cytochrome C domain-containing protein [Humisphaera borealis]QOV89038.1 PSD1 domain-containing protein [Humisphaera borealis]
MRCFHVAALAITVLSAAASAAPIDYARQIKPLLHEKCNACHGSLKQKAGLRTDAVQLLRAGGDGGAAIVAGKPDQSLLIHAVEGTHNAQKMPKDGAALSAEQIGLLRDWIAQGAIAEYEVVPLSPAEHWAFKRPVRPAVSAVNTPAGEVRNPIDAFIESDRARLGLSPLAEAPKHLLLRRVYLDLVGVPPTPAEMDAFLADGSPSAYESVVDRLLADSRYGQRWGRHWMDVWRYADWAGYGKEIRESRRGIWRWRDWIIESLNADRPYDEMLRLMIAADEIVGSTGASSSGVATPFNTADLRAGGYLARSWFKFNKNVWMDNTVEHFGKAFLGLTLNCARCHDHKYDPIEQAEYYQLRAYFEPIDVRSDPVPGLPDPEQDGIAMVYDKDAAAPTYLLHRGDEKQPVKDRPIAAGTPAIFGNAEPIRPVNLAAAAWYPGFRDGVRKDLLAKATAAVEAARAEADKAAANTKDLARAKQAAAEAELVAVAARLEADDAGYSSDTTPDRRKAAAEAAQKSERAAAVARAEATVLAAEQALAEAQAATRPAATRPAPKPKKPAEDKAKAVADARKALDTAKADQGKPLDGKYTALTATYPTTSTGRRTALAAWVTSPKNPLTARVAVNQIWMRHFGNPLVPTEFDFGLNGKPPTHPALLDWLAVELVERGWSMKAIHRLIVTSATYRLSSGGTADDGPYAANAKIDPDNIRLWRANVRRMDAEVVRDSLLSVTGNLDASLGGPELDEGAWQSSTRRSLYYRHAYEKQGVFALVFDGPSPTECYRRVETVTPQQSLALANSALAVSNARHLAAELAKQASPGDGETGFIQSVFTRVLSRSPTADELATCTTFIEKQSALLKDAKALKPHDGIEKATVPAATDPVQRARENLVQVLLNHNDFVTIR